MQPETFGARETEVEEPVLVSRVALFRTEAVFQVEFDIAAEPKALLPVDLRKLVQIYGSFKASARALGISEAFVRQNAREKRYSNKRRKS